MRCCLREYIALKRISVFAGDGDSGLIVAMQFREPDWRVAAILTDFGRLIAFVPAALEYREDGLPSIRVRSDVPESVGAAVRLTALDIDADALLGRPILSSTSDEIGGRIANLLINVREWCLKYFVVDNGHQNVLLHTSWVRGLSADAAAAIVDGLLIQSLRTAPPYPGAAELTPGFLEMNDRHYALREASPATG